MKINHGLWIKKEEDSYTVGMTPELQEDVGEIGFVMFQADDEIIIDGDFVELEASKMVVSVPAPITGKIIEKNTEVEDRPGLLNSENQQENWLVKLTEVDEESYNNLAAE